MALLTPRKMFPQGGTNRCQTCTQTCTQMWKAACSTAHCSQFVHPVADGEHVQLFKTMWERKKFYTVPIQKKGRRKLMNGCRALRILLICITHLCILSCIPESWVTYSKQLTGHEFHILCAGKWLVGSGVHPSTITGQQPPPPPLPVWGRTVVPGGRWTWGGGLLFLEHPHHDALPTETWLRSAAFGLHDRLTG